MTNAVLAALEAVAEDLDDAGARWALIGGFAVSARSEPRFTRDVDVAVAVGSDAEAEAIVARLVSRARLPPGLPPGKSGDHPTYQAVARVWGRGIPARRR